MKKPSQKNVKKTSAPNDPNLVPKGVPKWSQNHQKWNLGSTLFQGWLPRGLQSPSRINFGEVLGPCWDHFRQFFLHMCGDYFMHSFAACCKQKRSKALGITKIMQKRASKKQLLSSCHLPLQASLPNVNELLGSWKRFATILESFSFVGTEGIAAHNNVRSKLTGPWRDP